MAQDSTLTEGTFGYDLGFLKKHKSVLVLTAPDNADSRAIVVADYQGRVMTTTSGGDNGNSYGWINYELIKSGANKKHINAYGGEDRFWFSPEGGQFSVYFKRDQKFDFENWQTPAAIDSEPFDIVSADSASVKFRKNTVQENHSGTRFDLTIERTVSMLGTDRIKDLLKVSSLGATKVTAYESVNDIINNGADWKRETGGIGIWILGMFKPSDKTVIVAPFTTPHAGKPLLTSDYFGVIPADRLVTGENAVFLKADGKARSKIGLAPQSATGFAGSYDSGKGILTIVQYDLDTAGDYMKSTWEIHKDPYQGDALNAYNDGPLADGTQMGPFYELESSSRVFPLKKGEKLSHTHRTFHFEGDTEMMDQIARKVLGVSLGQISEVF
ncbi:DUF6786 family protein [Dyadobacter helix]|uniref:DUF6786 family protein n=1 Tax=Dyadobacter helix TaxID=2822344 RepID=UPI001BFC02EB|nr:DUF6786 family protein [Dyadobacter sp. CECT 9275]